MSSNRIISVAEYCEIAKVKRPTVSYRIKNNKPLPGIISFSYDKEKRRYDLVADDAILTMDISRQFRTH